MFSCQHKPAIDLAEVVIVFLARFSVQLAAQPSVKGTRCQATATPFSNSALYCGWICEPYSTACFTRSAGDIAVNS